MEAVRIDNDPEFQLIIDWAEKFSRMKVYSHIKSPEDVSHPFGTRADGLFLTTDFLFTKSESSCSLMQAVLLAEDEMDRAIHLEEM